MTAKFARAPSATGRKSRLKANSFNSSKSLPPEVQSSLALFEGDPPLDHDALLVLARLADLEVLAAPASGDDREGVPRRAGLVHQDGRRRSLFRGDLVLIRPAAVIRHRSPLEHVRVELLGIVEVRYGWIAHEHHDRLAPDIHPLVVVPLVLRGNHAIADEHHFGIGHLDLGCKPPRDGDPVLQERQPDRLILLAADPKLAGCRGRLEPDQGHVLDVTAVRDFPASGPSCGIARSGRRPSVPRPGFPVLGPRTHPRPAP